MKSICALHRLGCSQCSGRGIVSCPITAHKINFRVRPHPQRGSFNLTIRQEINDVMALHIYEDGAELASTPEREIIYSELNHLFNWCGRTCHHSAQKSHP